MRLNATAPLSVPSAPPLAAFTWSAPVEAASITPPTCDTSEKTASRRMPMIARNPPPTDERDGPRP